MRDEVCGASHFVSWMSQTWYDAILADDELVWPCVSQSDKDVMNAVADEEWLKDPERLVDALKETDAAFERLDICWKARDEALIAARCKKSRIKEAVFVCKPGDKSNFKRKRRPWTKQIKPETNVANITLFEELQRVIEELGLGVEFASELKPKPRREVYVWLEAEERRKSNRQAHIEFKSATMRWNEYRVQLAKSFLAKHHS